MALTFETIVSEELKLSAGKKFSEKFISLGVLNFLQACRYVAALPYNRNHNRGQLFCVIDEQCGTCSSKHALLKQLADENAIPAKLYMGIFKMNEVNTPKLSGFLTSYHLQYIPEAHCYLKINNQLIDCTTTNPNQLAFSGDLIIETELTATQAIEEKARMHQQFLQRWLSDNVQIRYTLQEIWSIREACIRKLSGHTSN